MILVTGGTGMLGSRILLECLKKNQPTRAIYRRTDSLNNIKHLFKKLFTDRLNLFEQIEWIKTDLNDLEALNDAFKGVKYVYHCAAKVSLVQFQNKKLIKTNIEGTANIVNLCIKHRIKKLGYVSSIASIGADRNIKIINENHSWSNSKNHTAYAYSKYEAELEVWRASQEGVDVVIVNPGVILGAHFWHRSSGEIFKRVNEGLKYYTLGNTPVVSLEDVVNCLITLMDSRIRNKRFILVSENLKQKILLDKIAIALDKRKPFFPLSKLILYFLFVIDKTLSILSLRKSYLSFALIDSLCNHQKYDGSKILSKINFKYTKINETIDLIAKQY